MAPRDSVWELFPELVDKLKALVATSISSAKIAKELGHGLTRNAVIGKTGRLGLKVPKPKATLSAEKVIRKHGGKRLHISNTNSHPIMAYEEITQKPTVSDLDIPQSQRKKLMQLERWHCRFPVGEPEDVGFFFCGATKLDDLPYCKHHAMRCYIQDGRRSPQYKWRDQA